MPRFFCFFLFLWALGSLQSVAAFDRPEYCRNDQRISIAGVGDILLHARLQRRAFSSDKGYSVLWDKVDPWLKSADITYANLEGPTATGLAAGGRKVKDPGKKYDDRVYTTFPAFN